MNVKDILDCEVDFEMEAMVAENILGWTDIYTAMNGRFYGTPRGFQSSRPVPNFLTDANGILDLMFEIASVGLDYVVGYMADVDKFYCTIRMQNGYQHISVQGLTPGEAIVKAVLIASMVEESE